MATSTGDRDRRQILVETGPLLGVVGACTAVLTATFVGIVGVASGNATAIVSRLPLYVLAGAVVFVTVLLVFEHSRLDGRAVLGRAVGTSLSGFVLVSLGTEGVIYAVTNPELVVASHLFAYLLAAAIIASGLGYWVVRNWRELSRLLGTSGL